MTFLRTVLGDVPAAECGMVYSHEHIVIDEGWVTQNWPDFLLNDLDPICAEVSGLKECGVGVMVDSMPLGAGRNARMLAEVSQRTGMHIIAPTGLHLAMYYPPGHWQEGASEDDLALRFEREIVSGMADDGQEPGPHRAGVIKVAGSRDKLTAAERRSFAAAARASAATGCPILTHTEQGTAALEQVRILADHGADLAKVCLSHLDRRPDPAYHREVLATDVRLEYDSAFRWPGPENPTLDLVLELAPEFPGQIFLGMDAARSRYWRSYGGSPGLDFLIKAFLPALAAQGLGPARIAEIMVHGPLAAFSFNGPVQPAGG